MTILSPVMSSVMTPIMQPTMGPAVEDMLALVWQGRDPYYTTYTRSGIGYSINQLSAPVANAQDVSMFDFSSGTREFLWYAGTNKCEADGIPLGVTTGVSVTDGVLSIENGLYKWVAVSQFDTLSVSGESGTTSLQYLTVNAKTDGSVFKLRMGPLLGSVDFSNTTENVIEAEVMPTLSTDTLKIQARDVGGGTLYFRLPQLSDDKLSTIVSSKGGPVTVNPSTHKLQASGTGARTLNGKTVRDIFNGQGGTLQDSGVLTVAVLYEIVTTTTDYFGAGLVIGDRFTAGSALALSASNSVKAVGAATGTTIFENFKTALVLQPDNARTFAIGAGSPVINGDQVDYIDESSSVTDLAYWDTTKTYKVSETISNYVGTGDITLPFDGADETDAWGNSINKSADGTYTYFYLPGTDLLQKQSDPGHTARSTTNSIKEVQTLLRTDTGVPILYIDPDTGLLTLTDGTNTAVSASALADDTYYDEFWAAWYVDQMHITFEGTKGIVETYAGTFPDSGEFIKYTDNDTLHRVINVYFGSEPQFELVVKDGVQEVYEGEPVIYYT